MQGPRLRDLAGPTVVLAATSCAAAALWLAPPARPPAGERVVVDERGRAVSLPRRIGRQAVFMAVGAGEYLLNTHRPGLVETSRVEANLLIRRSTLLQRAWPDLGRMRLTLSPAETGTVNVERLLRDRPDVVTTWARLAPGFERVGLPVLGLGPVSTTARLEQNTRLFSALADRAAEGEALRDRSVVSRRAVAADVVARTHGRPRVALVYWQAPGLYRLTPGFPDVVAQAGGSRLTPPMSGLPLDAERLIARAPDVVVVVSGAHPVDAAPAALMADPALAAARAVRTKRVYRAPPGVTGFMSNLVELPINARWLAEVLHPDELGAKARALARATYATELGVTPSEMELDSALAVGPNALSAGHGRFEAAAGR